MANPYMPYTNYPQQYTGNPYGNMYTTTPTYQQSYPQQNTYQPQPQMQPQKPSVPGRFVNGPDEITPSDIPMDGNASIFPVNDGSCILVKFWDRDGNIKTTKYIPDTVATEAKAKTASLDDIMKKLNGIEEKLSYKKQQPQRKDDDKHV